MLFLPGGVRDLQHHLVRHDVFVSHRFLPTDAFAHMTHVWTAKNRKSKKEDHKQTLDKDASMLIY